LEDSASVEGFLSVWGFNREQRWFVVATMGDGERAWDFGNGFGRKKEKEMAFFLSYLDYKA